MTAPLPISSPRPAPATRLPYAVAATAAFALAALYLTAGPLPLIPVYLLLIVASYYIPARLEAGGVFPWLLRAFLIFSIYLITPETEGDFALGTSHIRNIFGQIWAMEMTLRFWWKEPDTAKSTMFVVLFSGLLFLSATNTFEERYIRLIAPLYILSIATTALTYRERPQAGRSLGPRLIFLGLAFLMGFSGYATVYVNKSRLNEYGDQLASYQRQREGTGMAATPHLGETFDLRGSNARVLRISNFIGDSHLKGLAFDTYNSGSWSPAFSERNYQTTDASRLTAATDASPEDKVTMAVTRLVANNPLLFIPLQTASVNPGDASDLEWARDTGGPIRTRARPPFEYSVTVVTKENFQGALATPNLATGKTSAYRKSCLQLPQDFEPRVKALAEGIVSDAPTDRQKAAAIESYLISNHSYSSTYSPKTPDPIAGFLLQEPKASAHCEYFATSATLLLRCVGVPARYVTGYYVHEGAGEKDAIVRARDAHAWCEAWIDGIGWVVVEATPGDGRPGSAGEDSVEWWRRSWEKIQDTWQALWNYLTHLPIEVSYVALALSGFGIVAYLYARNRRRAGIPPPTDGYEPPAEALANLARRFEMNFLKRGFPFPETLPYMEYLAELETKNPILAERGREFADNYNIARFGNEMSAKRVEILRDLVESLEHDSRESVDSKS